MINKRSRWGLLAKKTSATMRMPASLSCQCQGRSRDQVVVGRVCPWTRLFAVCSADILFRTTRVLHCANSLGRVCWLLVLRIQRVASVRKTRWKVNFILNTAAIWLGKGKPIVCVLGASEGTGSESVCKSYKRPWLELKHCIMTFE